LTPRASERHELPRGPLTDDEIDRILGAAYRKLVIDTGYTGGMGGLTWDRAAARAVESAILARPAAPPAQEQAGQMVSDERILDEAEAQGIGARIHPSRGEPYPSTLGKEVIATVRAILSASPVQHAPKVAYPTDLDLLLDALGALTDGDDRFDSAINEGPEREGLQSIYEAVKQRRLRTLATPARADAPIGELTDTQLIDMLRQESMDLRCFDMPTGAGDADIGWKVIDFYMDQPKEREVAVVYHDDPREALRQAYRVHQFKRVAEGPRATPIAAPAGQPVTTAPLLAGRIAELAHRMCTQYAHVERIKYGFTEMHLLDFAWAIEREVLSSAATSSEAAPAPVPDGVWEALQRLIENGLMAGAASAEDARTVAEYRDRNGFIVGLAAPAPVVPTALALLKAMADEFVRVYPIHYYAEPWAHNRNVVLQQVLAFLASAPSADRAAAPAPVATLTDEELADCGLLSELDDGEAVEVRKEADHG
jgi:hypothetical protein